MSVDFKELEQELKKYCGFACYLDPDNCDCFGVMSKELRDELGINDYNEETDPFYTIQECLFFQEMSAPNSHILRFPYEYRIKNGVPAYYDLSPLKLLEKK